MKYHLISVALIVAAIVLKMEGYGNPGSNWGATLFVAGLACEFWFWNRMGIANKATRQRIHGSTQM